MSAKDQRQGRSYTKRAKVGEVLSADSRGRVDYEIRSGGGSLLGSFDSKGSSSKAESALMSFLSGKSDDKTGYKGRHAY